MALDVRDFSPGVFAEGGGGVRVRKSVVVCGVKMLCVEFA